jgi:hypothetical protein
MRKERVKPKQNPFDIKTRFFSAEAHQEVVRQ